MLYYKRLERTWGNFLKKTRLTDRKNELCNPFSWISNSCQVIDNSFSRIAILSPDFNIQQ